MSSMNREAPPVQVIREHPPLTAKLEKRDGIWDNGHTGVEFKGRLWKDRYGKLPKGRSFGRPEDEIRKVADIDPRATGLAPCALITADGGIHHMGGKPHEMFSSLADRAEMEDRPMANPDYFAVPFACHC